MRNGMTAYLYTHCHETFDLSPRQYGILLPCCLAIAPTRYDEEQPRYTVVVQDRCCVGQNARPSIVEGYREIHRGAIEPRDLLSWNKPKSQTQRELDMSAELFGLDIVDTGGRLTDRVVA